MRAVLPAGGELDDPLSPYVAAERVAPAGRPWVLANMVSALDGSAALGGRVGALTNPTDQRLFRRTRSLADVILVGAATVRNERYGAVKVDEVDQARRVAEGRPDVPRLAIVTRSLDLDWSTPLFTQPTSRPIVITAASADPARVDAASRVADVIVAGDETVDLAVALAALHDDGATIVLNEGGPTLLAELIGEELLDELCLTLAPVVAGDALRVVHTAPMPKLARFDLAHVLEEDGHLYLRYVAVRERPQVGGTHNR